MSATPAISQLFFLKAVTTDLSGVGPIGMGFALGWDHHRPFAAH
jgi:hypothetical protein